MRTCTVDGCNDKHDAKGYCKKHYARVRMHGDPHTTAWERLTTGTAWERLEQKIKKVDHGFYQPCWEYTGHLGKGYGKMCYENKEYKTHRVSYEHHNGPIPDGMQVDHVCCNKACCNPDHLDLVTPEENVALGGTPHFLPRFRSEEEDAANLRPQSILLNQESA